jgi:hypothetical protein
MWSIRIKDSTTKNFSKTFGKPLDKTAEMWYNIYVIKGRKTLNKPTRERKTL